MRRACLAGIAHDATTHAGLWLDKYIEGGEFDAPRKAALIQELARTAVPAGYADFVQSLRRDADALMDSGSGLSARATVAGRMVVGLGAKGVVEAGIRLDHTWGVPVIPGSALKGLAASTAHLLVEDPGWRKPGDGEVRAPTAFDALFGTTDEQGAVAFHDAYWIPEGRTLPIHPDVMTVHHPDYYQGDEPTAPSDFDSPTPIPFASVTGSFLVVLEGPPERCDEALQLLEHGLRCLGVGAKTSTGYGRMRVQRLETERSKRYQEIRDRFANAQPTPQTANQVVGALRDSQLPEDDLRRICGSIGEPKLSGWRKWAQPNDTELKKFLSPLLPAPVVAQQQLAPSGNVEKAADAWESVTITAQPIKKFRVTIASDGTTLSIKDSVPIDDENGFRNTLRTSEEPGCRAEAVVDRTNPAKIKVKRLRRPR